MILTNMTSWSFCGIVLVTVLAVTSIDAKPVRRGPPPPRPIEQDPNEDPEHTGLAYDYYLRQVVQVLESDPDFKKKLETANISDIKSGKIAMHLEMVNHTVRTALDEIKRKEIRRLQELARIQMQADPQSIRNFQIPGHLDLRNPHSFEMKDLESLILKTTSDLEELDKQRKEEFKQYELQKEFEKQQHLRELPEEQRKKEEARLEELKKKHAQHPKINHPGSKDQFEEVWEKKDHLEDQEFNPKTFFYTHDLDGDMEWSIEEVDAVLQLELDKIYDAKNSPEEDDPIERQEEMNRMREHVFQEIDKDKNWRISLSEFLAYTGTQGNNPEFEKDEGWQTVDEQDMFTDEEYQKFVAAHQAQPGVVQPPHDQDLRFQTEHQQQQQQQFQQQQQQFQQPQQGQQQQFQQPPQGQQQQQFQQPQQGQQQFQQPPAGQQQFQQPQGGQQQFQQPPGGQQQFQQPPGGQQQVNQQQNVNQQQPQVNQNQGQAVDQQELQKQLKDLQNQLNQQQQQQQQQQQPQGQQ